jgi:hypothetical protein
MYSTGIPHKATIRCRCTTATSSPASVNQAREDDQLIVRHCQRADPSRGHRQ